MSTVGELAAGVAHEINNPLNNMMRLTELMENTLEEGGDPQALREDLTVLNREERRCAVIVQGLLDFGRPKPPALEAVDLPQLVADTVRLLAPKARSAGITIDTHSKPDLSTAMIDRGQIQQVLVNMLLNAIQASPRGSEIGVWLERKGERRLRCQVLDRGRGVDKNHLQRIFEPFYTTRQNEQGAGLGLSVSYSIIQRHGGEVGASNREDGGLIVWFTLPIDEDEERTMDIPDEDDRTAFHA